MVIAGRAPAIHLKASKRMVALEASPWIRAETVEEQMFARDEDILRAAEDWRAKGRGGAVVTEALDVIETGTPKTLEFGVADETAWKVGLSCGGTIRVYVEKVE
jgi:xanthine/CO dehydrogenase XdhC/CoxF family maturation factor